MKEEYVQPEATVHDIQVESNFFGSCGWGHSWEGEGHGHENHTGPKPGNR